MLKIAENTVNQIMTSALVTVTPDTTAEVIKNIFDTQPIHHLPVVSGERFVGIISKIDLYRITHCIDLFRSKENELYNSKLLKSVLASEIMTSNATVLSPEDTIEYAASIFLRNEFHALPIVKGEKLVGIITTHDLLKLTFS